MNAFWGLVTINIATLVLLSLGVLMGVNNIQEKIANNQIDCKYKRGEVVCWNPQENEVQK